MPDKPEVPDTQKELAKIHETQKARGNGPDIVLPSPTYSTSIDGEVIDKGTLDSQEGGE